MQSKLSYKFLQQFINRCRMLLPVVEKEHADGCFGLCECFQKMLYHGRTFDQLAYGITTGDRPTPELSCLLQLLPAGWMSHRG